MSPKKPVQVWWCAAAVGAVLAAAVMTAANARAQDAGTKKQLSEVRSVDLRTAPEIPAVPRPAGFATNRPTMPMADYLAAKNAAAARTGAGRAKPGAAATPSASGVTLFTQVGSANESQTAGPYFPPDSDIATSTQWMVQVTNDQVVMYNWIDNSFKQVNLQTFEGDLGKIFYAPRVIHDPDWDRFVVLAAVASTGLSIAVSQTGDPSGAWWFWSVYATVGDFLDFPQLGMDLDAIIVTANIFTNNAFTESELWTFNKAHLYNGISDGFNYHVFGGGSCTMAPPYVLDRNPAAYVLSFCPGDTKITIGSVTNSSRGNAQFNLSDNTVSTGFHGLPPDAQQPGTNYTLDTGDNRFENRSFQVGSRIINTATISYLTINYNSVPAPAFYTFDIGAKPHTLVAANNYFASGTSNDWHPSIVANQVAVPSGNVLGEVFVTWMSTDPHNNVNLQLRAGGGLGDAPDIGNGIPVFTSPLPLTNQTDVYGIHRSGDYTSITTYPAAALGCQADEVGILTGETAAATAGLWSTRVGIVKHC
jgi:hypothetical protein